jgi:hypothetical protein
LGCDGSVREEHTATFGSVSVLQVAPVFSGLAKQLGTMPARMGASLMKRVVFLLMILVPCCCSLLNARPKNREGWKVVTAGDFVTFHIGLYENPQTAGRLAVLICPIRSSFPGDAIEPSLSRVGYIDTIANQRSYDLSILVPEDAPEGTWQAFFSFAQLNGSFSELRHTRVEFEVQHGTNIKAPQHASIGIN